MTKIILLLLAALVASGAVMLAAGPADPVNKEMAKHAVAVLRVRKLSNHGLDLPNHPLTRYFVRTFEVFKNESSERLNHDFAVHTLTGRPDLPAGEFTVYLTKYNPRDNRFDATNGTMWILIGGDITNGVSHVDLKSTRF